MCFASFNRILRRSDLSKWALLMSICAKGMEMMKSKIKIADIISMAPTSHAEKVGDYIAAMNAAFKDKSIHNIAVTGRYGAGKSSFLRTYFRRARWRLWHRQPLWVSVADFDSIGCKMASPQIQMAILQQILFVEEDKLMPFSRFSRIPRPGFWKYACITLAVMIVLGAFIGIFSPSWFKSWLRSFGHYGEWFYGWIGRLSPLFVVASLCVVCKYGYDAFRKGCMRFSLKVGPLAAESVALKDVPVLAQHFEELVYFFRSTRRREVVFEDLDRVADKGVFVYLRTLNQLLNEAVPVRSFLQRRPIRFIYAVRDDIFYTAEERVKYFDYILPIIPVLSSEMSANLMKKLLRDAKVSPRVIDKCSGVINKLCSYISDRRLVHAICNEFVLNKAVLMNEPDETCPYREEKILAMCAFKVFYPWAYAQLTDCVNPIVKLLDKKREASQKKIVELKKKIALIEDTINKGAVDAVAMRIKDLDMLYFIKGFLPLIPNGCVALKTSKEPSRLYKTKEFLRMDFIESLVGNVISFGMRSEYYSNQYEFPINCSWNEIENNVGGESYGERRKKIKSIKEEESLRLRGDIEAIRNDIYAIENVSLKDAVSHGIISIEVIDDCFRHEAMENDLSSKRPDYRVLYMLLSDGLISEDYVDYVTLYQQGGLPFSDYKFVVSVRQRQHTDPSLRIVDVLSVFDLLQDYCFLDRSAMNYDLISWLLDALYSEKMCSQKILERIERVRSVVRKILGNGHSVSPGWFDASDCYSFLMHCKNVGVYDQKFILLFKALADYNPELLNTFPINNNLLDDEKLELLSAMLSYNTKCERQFSLTRDHWHLLEQTADSARVLSECGMSREALIDNVKLHRLVFLNLPSESMPYPEYANDMLALDAFKASLNNLKCLGRLMNKTLPLDDTRVLTCIEQWGDENIRSYIVRHLQEIEDEITEKNLLQEDGGKVQRDVILREDIPVDVRKKVALNESVILIPMRDLPYEMAVSLVDSKKLTPNEDEFCDFIRVYIGNDDFIALAKKLGFNDDAMRRISKVIEECESRASTGADPCDTVELRGVVGRR